MDNIFKALADPTRRRILQLLRERELTAGQLADQFALSKSTLSAHFTVLRDAELVMSERSGTTITYRLNVAGLEAALRGMAEVFGIDIQRLGPSAAGGEPGAG